MRIILVFILLAFGFWPYAVNGQQISCTVPEPVEGTTSGASTSSAISFPRTVDCCPLSVDFHESAIRIADSLYKNYLPQYNFDEVKAAMEFFDSLRLTTVNSQQTTDFVHRIFPNRKQKDLCTVPEPVEGTTSGASTSSASSFPRTVDRCPLSVDFNCAKAHYYHAVGLTERDDIVGACEHYLTALEIMEEMMANDKSLRKKDKRLKAKVDNPEEYEKIRFIALIYTRLGSIYSDELCFDIAMDFDYKAYIQFKNINDTASYLYSLTNLGLYSYSNHNIEDSKYWYEKTISEFPVENNIYVNSAKNGLAQILYDEGYIDSAIKIIRELMDNPLNDIDKGFCKYTIAEMFYNTNQYDSALYYAKDAFYDNSSYTALAASDIIYKVYEKYGNIDSCNIYKQFYIDESNDFINKSENRTLMVTMYNDYVHYSSKKVQEKNNNLLCYIMIFLVIISLSVLVYKKTKKSDNIHERYISITNNTTIISIKNKISLGKIKTRIPVNNYAMYKLNYKELSEINKIIESEFVGFNSLLKKRYSKLSDLDLVYCNLLFLGFNIKEIFVMLGVEYSSASDKLRIIKKYFETEDIKQHLLQFVINEKI
ncbi:MAG: hypothetical protein IKW51_02140 [Bacteroidales bacterium]|nr:hypothetical protein [Bacteroidales bacterium]